MASHLVSLGFRLRKAYPCVFAHESRDQLTLVHGDDYATSGEDKELSWMQSELEKAYEIKSAHTGPGADSEGTVLNRTIGYDGKEWLLEADLSLTPNLSSNSSGWPTPSPTNDDQRSC